MPSRRALTSNHDLPAEAPAVTYYAGMTEALAVVDRERMVELMTHLREGSQRRYIEILERRQPR